MNATSRLSRSSFARRQRPYPFGCSEGFPKDRPTVECIAPFARLDLDVLGQNPQALGRRKPRDRFTLCLNAKATPALLDRGDPVISDECVHRSMSDG
jgi:hypothetical protein